MKSSKKEFLESRGRLGVEIMEAYHLLNDQAEVFFSGFDLTPQQYNVLAILHHTGPVSTSVISEWMFEKNPGVSRLVDRLVKKGLVTKKPSTADKRLIEVALTARGEEMYEAANPQLKKMDEATALLDEKEVEQLILLLTKMKGY